MHELAADPETFEEKAVKGVSATDCGFRLP